MKGNWTDYNIQKLTYMQHRYKINNSNEARKSSTNTIQSQKNDTLPYINLLDKCTQILRQDRIWIRNQIKANDEQILRVFKQAKKPINLQHLQIKLRKHVTAIKSKAKMEQLMKFKQNMHLGEWAPSEEKVSLPKKQHKYQLPSANLSSTSQSRGLKARMNNSVDKLPKSTFTPANQHRNTSSQHKKALDPYPAPMEQITERESENMTSARNRLHIEDGTDNFTFSHSYQQWKRPEQPVSSSSTLQSNYIHDPFKPKPNSNTYFNNFIATQPPSIKQTTPIQSHKPISSHQAKSPNANSGMMKNESYLITQVNKKANNFGYQPEDHYEDYSPQSKKKHDFSNNEQFLAEDHQASGQVINKSYLEDYSPSTYKQIQPSSSSSFLESANINSRSSYGEKQQISVEHNQKKDLLYYGQKESSNKQLGKTNNHEETDLLHSNNTIPFASGNSDSLFTSPELLAECRNFLKLKSSAKPSVEKDFTNAHSKITNQRETKFEPLQFDNYEPVKNETKKDIKDYSNSETSMAHLLNELNCGMTASIAQPHQIYHYQQPSLPFEPSMSQKTLNEVKPREIVSDENFRNSATQEYFHTFAALSSQKKQPQAYEIMTPEMFVDAVFDNLSDEPEGFVYWTTLQNLVSRKLYRYLDSFKQYLYPADEEKLVLISNIGRLLSDLLQDQGYQESQNDARNIYRLLDIEQKGYIVEQDVADFIRQLEESQAEDIDTISEYMWKLFETIDEDAEEGEAKRVDYWGIYSKKNSQEFHQLNDILRQFQFQIE